MGASRYVVGIDLGTTNSAAAQVDTAAKTEDSGAIQIFPITQTIRPGEAEALPLVPSFLYLPGPHELPKKSLNLPWIANPDSAVGTFARDYGAQIPTRLVSSAKSWLSLATVDRRAAILPWGAPDDVPKLSPVEASARYLRHMRDAWNHAAGKGTLEGKLEDQDVLLTVPASFDAVARELTVEAAKLAGLEHVTLLEEPQAALYSWIETHGDRWRKKVSVGDIILVCDIGGGTSDFTLIAVAEQDGELALTRVAVGEHILLGGDNMDRALAYAVQRKLAAENVKLDTGQMMALVHNCRFAKEALLADPKTQAKQITILGRGSKVVGGTIKTELTRAEVESVILDGFFPVVEPDARPAAPQRLGFQELGLPYAADPAVTKHLARFLGQQVQALEQERLRALLPKGKSKKKPPSTMLHPTAVLFNGGVFKSPALRNRIVEILNRWAAADVGRDEPVRELQGTDPDLAVARGAAYYGLVRRGKGIRIRGGAARSYYIGVASTEPAVPGMAPPIKALCVVPFGMEEGTEADIPGREFGLVVGEQAEFRFLSSTSRQSDPIGTVVEDWSDAIEELPPLRQVLEPADTEGGVIPVHLHSRVTEVGTLELSCRSRDARRSWKLEFSVREPSE
jgi:molecular chaperone DnaK (HSP70)